MNRIIDYKTRTVKFETNLKLDLEIKRKILETLSKGITKRRFKRVFKIFVTPENKKLRCECRYWRTKRSLVNHPFYHNDPPDEKLINDSSASAETAATI